MRDAQILNLGVNLQNYRVCTELHVDTAEGQRTGEICSFPYNLLLLGEECSSSYRGFVLSRIVKLTFFCRLSVYMMAWEFLIPATKI